MKKFAFLLAIVAVFAMSASAFAADSVTALGDGTEADRVNGIVSNDAVVSGDYSTKLFYVGEAKTNAKGKIGLSVAIDAVTDAEKIMAGTSTAPTSGMEIVDSSVATSNNGSMTISDAIEKTFANYYIGATKDDSGDVWVSAASLKSLDIIPTSIVAEGSATVYAGVANAKQTAAEFKYLIDKLEVAANYTVSVDAKYNDVISFDVTSKDVAISTDATLVGGTVIPVEILASATGAGDGVLTVKEGAVAAKIAGIADKAVLATITITVEKTDADLINDAIKASAVSKDLAAANDGKGGPVSLVMNAAGQIVSADLSKEQIALGKTGSLEIKIISLDLKGASSVDKVAAWGADSNAAFAAVVSDDENGGKQLTTIAPTKAADGISSILTYDVNAAKLLPARAASVDVDYARTISFPTTVGAKAVKVVVTETVERGDTSSGGACDMGLGLAAAALALVILKKRG